MKRKIDIPPETGRKQLAASDPKNSAWVSANAGSGKTYVLTQRVIRLMLDGVDPARILCLTFTKAAAAQMQNRIFGQLSRWVMLDDAKLAEEILYLSGVTATPQRLEKARQMFANALDTPGGLKIQTFHAFCEAILHQFPIEANIPGHFDVMDDLMQRAFLKTARQRILMDADQQLRADISLILSTLGETQLNDGIDEIVKNRQQFLRWYDQIGTAMTTEMADVLGIDGVAQEAEIAASLAEKFTLSNEYLREIAFQAETDGSANNVKLAKRINNYLMLSQGPPSFAAIMARNEIFLKKNGEPYASFTTKALQTLINGVEDDFMQEALLALQQAETIRAHEMLKLSLALFRVGRALLEQYARLKTAREKVDYDDLVDATANLLNRADIAPWIQYKLDQRIDHVLVDEAQDTSPRQWQIINRITDDFFAGSSASKTNRTMFAVGDEKQSIYSFQGARPEEFSRQAALLQRRVLALREADYSFENIMLTLSFRSTRDILKAVDRVFAIPDHFRGLGNSQGLDGNSIGTTHESVRGDAPGQVHIWSPFIDQRQNDRENWLDPVDLRKEESDPAILLARQITRTIKEWIGTPLQGTGQAISCGDILVLVRKRDRFVNALTRELKQAGLDVAGSDRLVMTRHIAIKDLIALARLMLMPEDDLSLAALFKSPLFDRSEDELFRLSAGRGKISLYQALANSEHVADQRMFGNLTRLRALARTLSVHDFFAQVLSVSHGRRNMLARFGHEVEDVLDAFLGAALAYTQSGGTSLEQFIQQLSVAEPEIKREFDQQGDEIRILTVHGAKGLEAPIVFLVDPCSPPVSANHLPKILNLAEGNAPDCFVWRPKKEYRIAAGERAVERVKAAVEEEYHRLLYVGMTRAADRLIVCGYATKTGGKGDTWLAMVKRALEEDALAMSEEGDDGFCEWIWVANPDRLKKAPSSIGKAGVAARPQSLHRPLPGWIFERAKIEPLPPKPLTPSGAHALILKEALERPRGMDRKAEIESAADRIVTENFALKRGIAIHRLLQTLPAIAIGERHERAKGAVQRLLPEATPMMRAKLLDQVFAILENPHWQDWFGPLSEAEVPLAGRIDIAESDGMRPRMVMGQIDRLYVSENEAVIIDYKTDSIVPDNRDAIRPEYLVQLALYRALVSRIYPGRKIVAGILWTETPTMMIVDEARLEKIAAA